MAYKKLGGLQKVGMADWRYFAGYCKYCQKEHYLTKEEAQKFVDYGWVVPSKQNMVGELMDRFPRIRIEWGIAKSFRQ